MFRKSLAGLLAAAWILLPSSGSGGDAPVKSLRLDLAPARWELRPGLAADVWAYNGSVPGPTIVLQPGERAVIEGTSRLPVPTNIHWHGLEVPNDQDGPGKVIGPGQSFAYAFTPQRPGTYWYHSHFRPVLLQVDMGLYGALVVRSPEDSRYSGDHILVLDDWLLEPSGRRLEEPLPGDMERTGNIETVNGKTGTAVAPLLFTRGELHKLRFVNASTAAVHTLRIQGHSFRITHTDGHPVPEPWTSGEIALSPGERVDAEVRAEGEAGRTYLMESSRPEKGLVIPIRYGAGETSPVESPFRIPPSESWSAAAPAEPDFVLVLDSVADTAAMEREAEAFFSGGGEEAGGEDAQAQPAGEMDHGGTQAVGGYMRWTINGKSWPDTERLQVKVGKPVRIRFVNRDTGAGDAGGHGMDHPMDHPMHLHGGFFRVVAVDGRPPERTLWKDTVNVPAGKSLDIVFVLPNPGFWMLHCHILDHEDGGMMTAVEAR